MTRGEKGVKNWWITKEILPKQDRARMVTLYLEGKPTREVANRMGYGYYITLRVLKEEGVLRPAGKNACTFKGKRKPVSFDEAYWGTPITKEQHKLLNEVFHE